MTRAWLDMLGHDSEFLNMNRLYDGCKTYHQRGNPWFSTVLHGFFGWWPCSSSCSTLVPPASEEVPGANDFNIVINCHPHCRQFWIFVVCNTSDINLWQQKRMMLVAINARLSPSFNVFHVTCNARRSLLLYQALQTGTNDPSSVLKLPRRTSGLFFVNGFQTHVQTTKMTTNSIRMQDEDPFSLAAWLHTVLKTCILRGNPWFSSMVLDGFLCFSMALRCFTDDGLAVINIVILTVGDLASNTSDMNQREEKCVVLVVIKR